MKNSKAIRFVGVAAMAVSALFATGCTKRTILKFEDNPRQAVLTMQVQTDKNYWLWQTHEHQFFTCSDKGSMIDCKRACGGNTDILCPMLSNSGNSFSTNTR